MNVNDYYNFNGALKLQPQKYLMHFVDKFINPSNYDLGDKIISKLFDRKKLLMVCIRDFHISPTP